MMEQEEPGPTAEYMLPPRQTALEFTRTPWGYARYYPSGVDAFAAKLLPLMGNRRYQPVKIFLGEATPRVVSNMAAGNAPGIAVIQALLALSVGAASLGKNATAEPFFGPRIFQELADLEKRQSLFPLSDLVALLTFRGSEREILEEFIHQGDHLQVTGGPDSQQEVERIIRKLKNRSPRDRQRRVMGHWHKVSFDLIGNEYLEAKWLDTVAFNVAFDNSMLNTQGCLSAQQVLVEGAESQVLQFAAKYLEYMRKLLEWLPKGIAPQAGLREMYHWYEKQRGMKILTSLQDIQQYPFFMVYDPAPRELAAFNGLNRGMIIRRVERLERDLPDLLGNGVRKELLQSCGLAVAPGRLMDIAEILGRNGVNRIVAAGDITQMRLGPGESWDGYLPPLDLLYPQSGYWTTISFQAIHYP